MNTERKDLELLMGHFRSCCSRRLRLWLGDGLNVKATGSLSFLVEHQGQTLEFFFRPQSCLWTLALGTEKVLDGDFDRLTKRVRQILTQPG